MFSLVTLYFVFFTWLVDFGRFSSVFVFVLCFAGLYWFTILWLILVGCWFVRLILLGFDGFFSGTEVLTVFLSVCLL